MKLILGTVQLGINYGITNISGKPTKEKSINIIQTCLNNNINTFDTARAYGTSEDVLGLFDDINIITKIELSKNYKEKAEKEIEQEINNSIELSSQKLKKIDVMLLHNMDHYYFNNNFVWNKLKEYKGQINKMGVSVYNVQECIHALKDNDIQHIQIPFNILDTRWFDNELQELRKKRRDITIHCRSIFLQGLIVSDITPKIKDIDAQYYIDQLNNFVKNCQLKNRTELAIAYVKAMDWIDGIVFGVDNIDQLNKNIELFKVEPLNNNQINNIKETFVNVPEKILDPRLWN